MLKEIFDMCSRNVKIKPLYVAKVGSFLYGTKTEESDTNYEVIYLPKKTDMLLGKTFDTSVYNSSFEKHTKNDYTIKFIPLHIFLKDLYEKNEIYAIELAFSMSNEDAVLYCHESMKYFFDNFKDTYTFYAFSFIGKAKSIIEYYKQESFKETYEKRTNCLFMMKELSDSYRYLEEAESLILKKDLIFPLDCSKIIKDVKLSHLSIERTMEILETKMSELYKLCEMNDVYVHNSYDSFLEKLINLLYED